MESIEYNGSVVLDVETEDDLSESMLMIRKLVKDGYSVDLHPHVNEDGMTEFLMIDIYDEKLSAEEFSEDYHAAAKVGRWDKTMAEDEPLTLDEFMARIDGVIKRINKALEQAKLNAKQSPK